VNCLVSAVLPTGTELDVMRASGTVREVSNMILYFLLKLAVIWHSNHFNVNKGSLNIVTIYRVIQNNCRAFNNLPHTIHLRKQYMCFLFNRTTLQVFVTYLTGALYVHPL